jgi:hypothetical protein
MPPKISVVIVNWNNWQETGLCLQQLSQVSHPDMQLEIIVVDNGSDDCSQEELRKKNGIVFLPQEKNLGFAGGSNVGIRAALEGGCDFVMLLNNDTILPGGFLEPLLRSMENNKLVGIATPKINYATQQDIIWFAGGQFHPPRIFGSMIGMNEKDAGQWDTPRVVDYAVGCCMLIRREVFEKIGLLDEMFFFYLEDVDFCYRAQKAGYLVYYQPQSLIYHKVAQSTRDNIPSRIYLHTQSRILFFFKHIKGLAIIFAVILESLRLLRTTASYLFKREWHLLMAYLKGNMDGVLLGIRIAGKDKDSAQLTLSPNQQIGLKRYWPILRRIIPASIFIFVFSYLAVKGYSGIKLIYESGTKFHWEYLVISFICQLTGVMIAAFIWSHILKRLEVQSNYLFDLSAFCISALAKKVPGMVVYAVSRLVMYTAIKASKIRVTFAMITEMAMISLAGLLVFAITAGSSLLPASWKINNFLVIFIIIVLVILACLAAPGMIQWLVRMTQGKSGLNENPSNLKITYLDSFFWLIGEVVVVVLAGAVGYFLVKSVELPDSVPYSAIIKAFSLSVALGPLSVWLPGDIGLRDGIMFLAMRPYTSASIGALITLIYRFWSSFLEITFGLVAGIIFQRRFNKKSGENSLK